MDWESIDTWEGLIRWLRSKEYAVLCGSGVSWRSGLPTGQEFNQTFLEDVVSPDWRPMIRSHLQPDSEVPLRFEGILDVWWRIVDPELRVLDAYRFGEPTSEHYALAHLARSHAIVTTNFDGLIERAWTWQADLNLAYTDEHFKSSPLDSGLYKIHGTLQCFTNGRLEELSYRDEGFPIATLRAISANMESLPRRSYMHKLRKSRPLLVVGYSGMDDFDVSRWLVEPSNPKEGVWIQFDPMASDTAVLSAQQAIEVGSCPRPIRRLTKDQVLDPAARDRVVDAWKVVHTNNPGRLLAQLSGQPFQDVADRSEEALNWRSPSDWQRSIVTAMLLLQLSRFRASEDLLRGVLDTNALSPVETLKTKVCLAQAIIPSGDPHKREEALSLANTASDSKLVDDSLRQRAIFLATQARFFTRRSSARELGHDLDILYRRASASSDAELAVDIAVFGGQHARSHPTMKVAFDSVEAGGSLPAKGIAFHEAARSKWSRCESTEMLRQTISAMERAIAFRRDLGQLDGACASLNVCGTMYQRFKEWISPVTPVYDAAALRHAESLRLATEAGLVWHRSQALINLAYIDAKKSDPKGLSDRIAEINQLGEALDDSDWHHLAFLTGYTRVLAGDFDGAVSEYETLVALPASAKLGDRMRGAATFNAQLCRAWILGKPMPAELPPSHKGVAFWEHRLGHLGQFSKELALIDSLPPSN